MKSELLIGLGTAVFAGVLIGIQTTFISRGGAAIGDTRSGMLTTALGAVFAILVLAATWRQAGSFEVGRETWIGLLIAGILGTIILSSMSFASQSLGITTTLATLLLGQMLITVFVDHRGLGGGASVPITWVRLVGILLLFAGVYLTLWRKS